VSKTIQTHGDIREFLTNAMLAVKNGDMKEGEARTILKIAEKVNENLYAEIKAGQFLIQMGKVAGELGSLPVNK
jgi:hypothetical protein